MSSQHFAWIDLEMTGLKPESDKILEVALIVTNQLFEPIEDFQTPVIQDETCLKKMDPFVLNLHTKSGLLERINEGISNYDADKKVYSILKKYVSTQEKIILCGNSIHMDRKFIDIHFPLTASLLHYRMLDVSSFKIVFQNLYKEVFQKKNTHRAHDDIIESINELKHYLQFVRL